MTAQPIRGPALRYQSERPEDSLLAEALIERVFGPGRFVKSSERVREFATFRGDLSFCAWSDGRLVGVVHQHLISIGGRNLVFLGPLAVEAEARKSGAGLGLVAQACAAADAAGYPAVLLVGDPPFFARAGFVMAPAGRIIMPGPVDPHRLLIRALSAGGADNLAGPVAAPI